MCLVLCAAGVSIFNEICFTGKISSAIFEGKLNTRVVFCSVWTILMPLSMCLFASTGRIKMCDE